ncbi:ribosome hibernation-promoting factor, HPF/YfiA family [Ahrensia sp. 13_GOM-1096m]|uniref:ribosome hibernation-promoting factor, HPF/YfiA family n=1 Tax=Ahrensia sp. 13_GOM-1096m TaxID=1380380 RepID=UPI00047A2AEB|nr:ribosome-associated translation inhibitor RaiA [Ahrensia sp. 13_GOM-1096m]
MSLRISGKHMEIGDAFKTRIEDRIEDALTKYFDKGAQGHVTVEKYGNRFTADCVIHLDTGTMLQASGDGQDPDASFDSAAERLEKRLRRYKRRLKNHHTQEAAARTENYAYKVLEALPEDDEEDLPVDYAPVIVAETQMKLTTLPVASAVLQLDLQDNPVYVFRNAGSGDVNLVYRRPDGNIGWIDPGALK